MSILRQNTKVVLTKCFPQLLWRYRQRAWNWGGREEELKLLPQLFRRDQLFVDIGGCLGVYTVAMLAHSRRCVVFEARPNQAEQLQQAFEDAGSAVAVHAVALSDQVGTATMRVCEAEPGRSTLLGDSSLVGATSVISVPTRRLDDYQLRNVGFIKIDVEGHEEAVLKGASETLQRERPNLLVELEDNRNSGTIERTRALLQLYDLKGYFLTENRFRPLSQFRPEIWQVQGKKPYINNFLFLRPENVPRLGLE